MCVKPKYPIYPNAPIHQIQKPQPGRAWEQLGLIEPEHLDKVVPILERAHLIDVKSLMNTSRAINDYIREKNIFQPSKSKKMINIINRWIDHISKQRYQWMWILNIIDKDEKPMGQIISHIGLDGHIKMTVHILKQDLSYTIIKGKFNANPDHMKYFEQIYENLEMYGYKYKFYSTEEDKKIDEAVGIIINEELTHRHKYIKQPDPINVQPTIVQRTIVPQTSEEEEERERIKRYNQFLTDVLPTSQVKELLRNTNAILKELRGKCAPPPRVDVGGKQYIYINTKVKANIGNSERCIYTRKGKGNTQYVRWTILN